MDYPSLVEAIVDELLEVEVLPDAYVTKNAEGDWEKKEAAPGEVSPLSKAGIRSPRVNMGMRTPTTTFLPFAGLSPAVKEVRARTGDEDVQVVPGQQQSYGTLLKASPTQEHIRYGAKLYGMRPVQLADKIGREHLIVLGPAKGMAHGVEAQRAVFGHEAGHIINKDTIRQTQAANGIGYEPNDAEVVASEEQAWDTGEGLLKDMGISHSPHERNPSLYTYYTNRGYEQDADITKLSVPELQSLHKILTQPDSGKANAFRLRGKTYNSPEHFLNKKFKAALNLPE